MSYKSIGSEIETAAPTPAVGVPGLVWWGGVGWVMDAPVISPLGCTTRAPVYCPAFTQWCKTRNILWEHTCRLAMGPSGRCVVATCDIPAGQVAVEVSPASRRRPEGLVLGGLWSSLPMSGFSCRLGRSCRLVGFFLVGFPCRVFFLAFQQAASSNSLCAPTHKPRPAALPASAAGWQVPDDAVLLAESSAAAAQLESAGLLKPADHASLEVQGLIFAVMVEKRLGNASKWAPYLEVLPADVGHMPFTWAPQEVDELRGTAGHDQLTGAFGTASDAPCQVELAWRQLGRPFLRDHPELGVPTGSSGYSLYCWATAVVASYSFVLGDERFVGMVPVWDLLNHESGRANVRLRHCAERGVLQVRGHEQSGARGEKGRDAKGRDEQGREGEEK